MIDLSVVIPSHGDEALLPACLGALARARAQAPAAAVEVILVDNGSRDRSVAVAAAACEDLRVIAFARNRGFATAVNAGIRARRGRHVLLLNSDAEVGPELLAKAVGLLDAEPAIGVLGAALFHADGRPQRSVHALPDWRPSPVADALRRRVERVGSRDAWRDVEAVRGAVFFIGERALETVGGLDEGYFFFLEETDYCARVRDAGFRVAFWPALRAVHALGASSKARAPFATRVEYERSLDRFLRERRGRAAAFASRILRCLRFALGMVALVPLLPATARLRGRERAGLLLWHLRGRPATPSLADARVDRQVSERKPA